MKQLSVRHVRGPVNYTKRIRLPPYLLSGFIFPTTIGRRSFYMRPFLSNAEQSARVERPASCLTDLQLTRFMARLAKSRERLRYLRHLKICDGCRGAVADYQKNEEENDVEQGRERGR